MTNQNKYSEAELILLLKKQDSTAFEYLYHNYKLALYTVILQFITDKEVANDTLQEVFITIHNNIDKYDHHKGRLFTWLHTIARNTSINKVKSKDYLSQQKNDTLENFVSQVDETRNIEQNIDKIGLRKQVGMLRQDYRAVIELSYFSGFTHEEISKELDIPLGTVKTRLRNSLIELKRTFV